MKNNADKTSELLASLSTIHSKEDFEAYLNTHTQMEFSFSQYYNSILHCKNISLAEAVKNSTLERHYAYQIVNGTKANPGRDKILCLCIAARMDINETRRALEISNARQSFTPETRATPLLLNTLIRKIFLLQILMMTFTRTTSRHCCHDIVLYINRRYLCVLIKKLKLPMSWNLLYSA